MRAVGLGGGVDDRMIASWLAVFWLALIAPAGLPEAGQADGKVVVDALEVLDEPDESAYSSGTLRRGDRVTVVTSEGGKPGWLAIAPPSDAFDWVDASALQIQPDGGAVIVAARTPVRSGATGARMPGPPRPPLLRGAAVRLVDRPPLRLGEGSNTRIWRAIAPPDGEVRHVRLDGVRLDPVATSRTDDPAVQLARFEDRGGGETAQAIARFEEALRRSRQIDHQVFQAREKLALAQTSSERAYDARGLLQASSRQVGGQKVHALIGPEGTPIAYLAIPPGIAASRLLSRKVGVRGEVHFNQALGNRLITVRDLDPLDRPR